MMTLDIADLRREYKRGGLRRADLDPDPVAQFERWFGEARNSGQIEPNAMSLATASAQGRPTLRTVLLKYFDRSGFVFYTNLESTKAHQIAANPYVALMFAWLETERQLTILGRAEEVGRGETLKYFMSRPRGSQLGAWISHQSSVVSSRTLLEMKFEEMRRKWKDREVPLPSFWGGFRVVPESFEFWQGRAQRLHDRFLYTRTESEQWRIERLAP
jgi:pyridoxamine 5'-phosphate oxidase